MEKCSYFGLCYCVFLHFFTTKSDFSNYFPTSIRFFTSRKSLPFLLKDKKNIFSTIYRLKALHISLFCLFSKPWRQTTFSARTRIYRYFYIGVAILISRPRFCYPVSLEYTDWKVE